MTLLSPYQVTSRQQSYGAMVMGIVATAGLMLLGLISFARNAPYIDTAWQIGISRSPTFSNFLARVRADNQAPVAQLVFWVAARLGAGGIMAQRLVSLILASASLVAVVVIAPRFRRGAHETRFAAIMPTRGATIAAAFLVLMPGLFIVSGLVRYASFITPLWLAAFILTSRSMDGQQRLIVPLGLLTSLSLLVSYSALILIAVTWLGIALRPPLPRMAALMRLTLSMLVGAIFLLAWLVIAGEEHLGNVFNRVGDETITLRGLIGKGYELVAWLGAGPSSLPSALGLVLVAAGVVILTGLLLLTLRSRNAALPELILFACVPVPLFFLVGVPAGWSMAGPTVVVGIAAAAGAATAGIRGGTLAVGGMAALTVATVLGVATLRPVNFASQADQAISAGYAAAGTSGLLVSTDWTLQLLASENLPPGHRSPAARLDPSVFAASKPTVVVLVMQDPGQSSAADGQDALQRQLEALGYSQISSKEIAPYDNEALREKLQLVSLPSQYVVETWSCNGSRVGA